MTSVESVISGVGSQLPGKVVTNHDLAKIVDTSDEWIRSRSGIGQRHIAGDDEVTSDYATAAAWKLRQRIIALEKGLKAKSPAPRKPTN